MLRLPPPSDLSLFTSLLTLLNIDMMTSGFSKPSDNENLVKVNPGFDAKFVHQNFLPLVAKAMSVLPAGQLICHTARCFGEQCHGDVDPRMPLDRMPFISFIAVKAHLVFFNSIL
jgi:hypothetical protein